MAVERLLCRVTLPFGMPAASSYSLKYFLAQSFILCSLFAPLIILLMSSNRIFCFRKVGLGQWVAELKTCKNAFAELV
jgi:hypothetical protein